MRVLLHAIISLLGTIAAATFTGAKINLRRCADAKIQNHDAMSIVVVVSSIAHDFGQRSELRQTDFRDAKLLSSRTVFRPMNSAASAISKDDSRPVCVQPLFVISPWVKQGVASRLTQYDWRKLAEESHRHQDVLISPVMINPHTTARELMHVLEWSHKTVPWADYIVSVDSSVTIHWARMIELFPPPVPQKGSRRALWQLGRRYGHDESIFFKGPHGTWRPCVDTKVSAFSRDLVRQMVGNPLSTQILWALRHPFRAFHVLRNSKPDDGIFGVISTSTACEGNSEGITAYKFQAKVTLALCRQICLSDALCNAFDWFCKTGWCNLYKEPCRHPLKSIDNASSYYRLSYRGEFHKECMYACTHVHSMDASVYQSTCL